MGSESSRLKFALIGHQDSWSKIVEAVNSVRSSANNFPLNEEVIRDTYGFFPPLKLFDVQINLTGKSVHGGYIETFISPDELGAQYIWRNVNKIKSACRKAANMNADVVSLGGFTSILLEATKSNPQYIESTAFTTGNTLTAAFITEAVKIAASKWNFQLSDCTIMIIGSTGDIGSACVKYFSTRAKKLSLVARNEMRLKEQAAILKGRKVDCKYSINLNDVSHDADVVISVASSLLPDDFGSRLPVGAIVCDAGYPKTIYPSGFKNQRVFYGGMGVVEKGYTYTPDSFTKPIYSFPVENIIHGCLLESMVLAAEGIKSAYSFGKSNITLHKMKSIKLLAARHGIHVAPLFNEFGAL